jgi:hypothetical protein
MLSPDQFRQQAMDIIQKSKGVIEGDDAKTVFRATNIRSWPLTDHPTNTREGWTESESEVRPSETLHTTQSHLHGPTIRRYMSGDIPEFDPDYEGDFSHRYLPEVMRTTRGTPWINEGHHRLVASRLNEYPYEEVWEGPLLKMRH